MPEIAKKNSVPQNNIALANIFHHMSDCYRYLGNEERFRAIAYKNVTKILLNMKEDNARYATDTKTLDVTLFRLPVQSRITITTLYTKPKHVKSHMTLSFAYINYKMPEFPFLVN